MTYARLENQYIHFKDTNAETRDKCLNEVHRYPKSPNFIGCVHEDHWILRCKNHKGLEKVDKPGETWCKQPLKVIGPINQYGRWCRDHKNRVTAEEYEAQLAQNQKDQETKRLDDEDRDNVAEYEALKESGVGPG